MPPLVGDSAVGVDARMLAMRRRISSNGPGVCPPSRVLPQLASAMAWSSRLWSSRLSPSSEDEVDGEIGVATSARRSMCDLTYLLVVISCVKGLL
jgi:hypothetical protein